MGLFDFFKKKNNEPLEAEEPEIDAQEITSEIENEIIEEAEELEEDEAIQTQQEDMPPASGEEEETIFDAPKEEQKAAEAPEDADAKEGQEDEMAAEESAEDLETLENPQEKKKGLFARLTEGLAKTRDSILGGVDNVLKAFTKVDEELFEELEEALIMSDIGVNASTEIIESLRERVKKERITDGEGVKNALEDIIREILIEEEENKPFETPAVLLIVGVNGVGKTTTIGKLSSKFRAENKKVVVAAADTFRAAAIDQLEIWGRRAGIEVIKQNEGSDPGAVIFDAINAAKARKADVLICDTAGRLHNKKNLMDELGKINKIIDSQYAQAHKETYIVLDATAGQNSLQQAKTFKEVCDLTGIVLTKLDGTAKGGIVVAIKSELAIPVKYVGVGEGVDDLQAFNAEDFAKALFAKRG